MDIAWRCSSSLCTDARAIFRPTCFFSTVSERTKNNLCKFIPEHDYRRRFTDVSSPDFSWGSGDVCTQAREERSISPITGVRKDEKGKISKTRRLGIWSRAEQECFTATFLFFNKCSIPKSISLFLGKMFKLVIHRPSFITSFENRRVKKDSEQLEIHDSRSTTSRWQMMMMKNDSAEVDQRVRGTFTQMYFVRNF